MKKKPSFRVDTADWRPDLKPIIRPPAPREGQTFAGTSVWVRLANFVKLPHTVFALPFALVGVVYASYTVVPTAGQLALIVVAFTAARFAAMGFNRIVDRRHDAMNPRTRERELPTGALRVSQAVAAVTVAGLVFVGSAFALNPLCGVLALPALGWILLYSYTKRLTHWAHAWLGVSLAIAPAGGYLGITGAWSDPWWTLPVMALAVATWVAGFDVFYALQDEDFDRRHGLRSLVVRFGQAGSILLAKVMHGVTIGALVGFGLGAGWGVAYFGSVIVAAGILVWEHQLVRPHDLSRLNAAFFTMNGIMSIVIFLGALADRWF